MLEEERSRNCPICGGESRVLSAMGKQGMKDCERCASQRTR